MNFILSEHPSIENKLHFAPLIFLLKDGHVKMYEFIIYTKQPSLFVIFLVFWSSVDELFHHLKISKNATNIRIGRYIDSISSSSVEHLREQKYIGAGQLLSKDICTCLAMLSDHFLHSLQSLFEPMCSPFLPTSSVILLDLLQNL